MIDPELISKSPLRRAMEQVEARGEARGEARSLLAVLVARGFAVSEAVRQRVYLGKDAEVLHRWVGKAAVAESVEAVFDGD